MTGGRRHVYGNLSLTLEETKAELYILFEFTSLRNSIIINFMIGEGNRQSAVSDRKKLNRSFSGKC